MLEPQDRLLVYHMLCCGRSIGNARQLSFDLNDPILQSFNPHKSVPSRSSTQCQKDQYKPLAGSQEPFSRSKGPSPMIPSFPVVPLFPPTNQHTIGMLLRTRSPNDGCGGNASDIGRSTAFFTLMCVMYSDCRANSLTWLGSDGVDRDRKFAVLVCNCGG